MEGKKKVSSLAKQPKKHVQGVSLADQATVHIPN